jgi:CheY-like chemotaxis protein
LQEYEEFKEYFISFLITVKDYGMGIPTDKLNNLFINFSRIEENASVNKNGVGLGLSICKDLIDQMGGSVNVYSEQFKFTKFIIQMNTTCKIKDAHLHEIKDLVHSEEPTSPKSLKSIEGFRLLSKVLPSPGSHLSYCSSFPRILLANDSLFLLDGYASLLSDFFNVEQAVNGLEAFNKVKEHPKDYYDAILLDINMPIMDGVEASNKIHAFLEDEHLLSILCMTPEHYEEP